MPRLAKNKVPSLRCHRASNQAVVTLAGKDYYCGPHGTEESTRRYNQLVAEWLAAGRKAPATIAPRGRGDAKPSTCLVIAQLCERYLDDRAEYFGGSDGKPTHSYARVKIVVKLLMAHYPTLPADELGPVRLRAIREHLIEQGQSRRYINELVSQIKLMFRWGCSRELVPATTYQALATVDGLKQGKTRARETERVLPVSDAVIETTKQHLSQTVRDMVTIARHSGMRPGEVCIMRPCDIDRTGDEWEYRPHYHKSQYRGRTRVVTLGPRCKAALAKYLDREPNAYCFSPIESEAARRAAQFKARITPLHYGNRPGTNKTKKPKRTPGKRYTSFSFGRAIERACLKAFPVPEGVEGSARDAWIRDHSWAANQLRHSYATEVRKMFDADTAQVCLDHSKPDVTQRYAEPNLDKKKIVAARMG